MYVYKMSAGRPDGSLSYDNHMTLHDDHLTLSRDDQMTAGEGGQYERLLYVCWQVYSHCAKGIAHGAIDDLQEYRQVSPVT